MSLVTRAEVTKYAAMASDLIAGLAADVERSASTQRIAMRRVPGMWSESGNCLILTML
jgi:hypothetical protein